MPQAGAAAEAGLSKPAAYWGPQTVDQQTPASVQTLIKFIRSRNLAEQGEGAVDQHLLNEIGQRVRRGYETDEQSRTDWLDKMGGAMDLAMQIVEAKNYPFPKASNIKYPLLTTAAVQFNARAYPALIPGKRLVKPQIHGNDNGIAMVGDDGQPVVDQQGQPRWKVPPGAKRARGERVSTHMSYQLLEEDEAWEGETDKLLIILPIVGCAFRKTTHDLVAGMNRSELVLPTDLVVNYRARSLERAPRVTHVFKLYPQEIAERKADGRFLDIDLGYGQPPRAQSDRSKAGQDEQTAYANDPEAPHTFLEQHRWEDLDGDGFKEPYIVTTHEATGHVLRIVARFGLAGIKANPANGKIIKIEPIHYFTKYGFLPNPDGGFYDMGFGLLLGPISESISTSLNLMFDAGHMQNAGGGFLSSALRIKSGYLRIRPGQWKILNVPGGKMRDSVLPFAHPGPSAALFNLLGLLIEAARDISSVKDVMTGDMGPANEAAVRTMARIEQGMKVFTAIYKRIYRAMKAEFKKLFLLNFIYLDEKTYFNYLDTQEQVSPKDYNLADFDIVPVADPNSVSDLLNAGRAEFLMQFVNDRFFNQREVRQSIMSAANMPDVDKLLLPQPSPDMELAAKADEIEISKRRAEIEYMKVEAEVRKLNADAILAIAKAEEVELGPQLKSYVEQLKSLTRLSVEEMKGRNDQAKARANGGVAA